MDEPLLNGISTSYQYNKKSDHPVLSLFSPRGRRNPGGFDNFSLFLSQPSSPTFLTSPSTHPRTDGLNKQHRRSESFGGSSSSSPRLAPNDDPGRDPSFRSQGVLDRIPEETATRLFGSSYSAPDYDLEAPNDFKGDDTEETGRRIGEEALIYDEEKAQQDRKWKSMVSAIIHNVSTPPEHDYFGCPTCNPRHHSVENHDFEDHLSSNDANEFSARLPVIASLPDFKDLDTADQDRAPPELPGGNSGSDSGDGSPGIRDDGAVFGSKSKRRSIHRAKTAPMLLSLSKCQRKKELADKSRDSSNPGVTSIVGHAFAGLCVYLTVGVIIYTWKREEFSGVETVTIIDALYFCVVTMCTIGYGDITPVSPSAKLLACLLMFVGFGFIDALLSGMVTIVLDRQEHLLLTVVEDGHHERARNYFMNPEKGRMRIRLKVALAVGTVVMTILVGVIFLRSFEGLHWIDSFYVTCISITTVGFGDYSFQTKWGRLFAAVWLLLSTLGVARAFLYLAEARVHSRHRHLAKRILAKAVTADDLNRVDLDNDGHISKSEFVVYKLEEMGKIEHRDVLEICSQFDVIDSISAGKITLGQLKEVEENKAYN